MRKASLATPQHLPYLVYEGLKEEDEDEKDEKMKKMKKKQTGHKRKKMREDRTEIPSRKKSRLS
jgi:hypothetical protein